MGTLRQSVEIPAQPYEVAGWLFQYTARVYESIFSLKGESYQLSREQPQWSDQDQRYVMELRAFGPLFPRGRAKRTDWFVRVRIRKSEKRDLPTEVTVSCNVGGDMGKYYGKLVTAMQGQWRGAKVHFLGSPENEPGAGWIRSEVVPGSVGHFQVTMERLYIQYRHDGWMSSSGDKLRFSRNTHTDDKRGTWAVTLRREDEPPCFAGIEAYERSSGDTLVEFRDGYEPGSRWRVSPIGPSFVEFSDTVIREAQPTEIATENELEAARLQSATAQRSIKSESPPAALLEDLLPKKLETRVKYKKAYDIVVQLREEYRELYEDEEIDKPTPRTDDYRDALAFRMGWKPTHPVLSKIIKLGEGGLLEDY